MAIYLIDYENTTNLSGIDKLTCDDKVVIFYSKKADSISFDCHKSILFSQASVEYKLVDVGGTNALDFQLSTYIGYLVKQTEAEPQEIYIVSKDKGYTFVASFWKNEKASSIGLITDLNKTKPPEEQPKIQTAAIIIDDPIETALKQSNISLTDSELSSVIVTVKKFKTIQAINSNLNKLLKDSTKCGEIIAIIKPIIKKQ